MEVVLGGVLVVVVTLCTDVDDSEDSVSSGEEVDMCPPEEHKWSHNVCMICKFCGYCTGYGPGCCNQGLAERNPGR